MANITITHTPAEGTLATGDTRPYTQQLKTHGWRWGRSIGCWFIPNSRDHLPKEWKISETVKALEAAGAVVEQDIIRETVSTAEREANKSERIEDRQDALAAKSERKANESQARYDAAQAICDRIPFGQPILVGHHSERGARADQKRIHNHMDKFCELHSESREAARKAAASERNASHRLTGPATLRRIERLETDLRKVRRTLAESKQYKGTPWYLDCEHRAEEYEDDLDYWRGHLAALEAEGLKVWTAADFKAGDIVQTIWGPKKVIRVNPKTLSCDSGYSWPDKIPYDRVKGRIPAETVTEQTA